MSHFLHKEITVMFNIFQIYNEDQTIKNLLLTVYISSEICPTSATQKMQDFEFNVNSIQLKRYYKKYCLCQQIKNDNNR